MTGEPCSEPSRQRCGCGGVHVRAEPIVQGQYRRPGGHVNARTHTTSLCQVIVLGSATVALSAIPSPTLAALRAAGNAATILTDPDVAGRQARNALEELLEEPWHAFLPVRHCTSLSATP